VQRRSTVANLGEFIWRVAVRDLGAAALAVVVGLLPYLYLPAEPVPTASLIETWAAGESRTVHARTVER